MTLGPFFKIMADKFQDKFTLDGFTIEVSNAAVVLPAVDVFISENRVVFFKSQADRLITLSEQDANVFAKNEKRFVACMTKILESFKPESLGMMNQIAQNGLLTNTNCSYLLPFVYKVNRTDSQFQIFMSERFYSSLPTTYLSDGKALIIQTGSDCHLQKGGFLEEGLYQNSKVLCLDKERFSGKTVSIRTESEFIGRRLCIQNAQLIIDTLLDFKKTVFDKKFSADEALPNSFKVY